MNNTLQIVVIVLAIQGIALFVAMAFGRAAKAGDSAEAFDDAQAFGAEHDADRRDGTPAATRAATR